MHEFLCVELPIEVLGHPAWVYFWVMFRLKEFQDAIGLVWVILS